MGAGVEEGAEDEAAEIEEAEMLRPPPHPLTTAPSIKGLSILTFRLEIGRGVDYISNSVEGLIFVRNPPRVLGRMCSLRDLQNETGTSSVTHL